MTSQHSTPEKTSTRKKGGGKRGNKNAQSPTNDSIVALAALLEIKRQPTTTAQSSHPSTPSLNPNCASADPAMPTPSPSLQVPSMPSSQQQQQQQQQAALGHHLWHQHRQYRQQHNLRASPPLTLAASPSAACAGSPPDLAAATAAAAALMYLPPSASSSVAVRAVHHHHQQQAAMARFLRHQDAARQHAAAVAAAARSGGGVEATLGVPRLPPLVGGPMQMQQAGAPSPQQMTIGRGQLITPVTIMPHGLGGFQPHSQAMTHTQAQAKASAPAPAQAQAQAKVQSQAQAQAKVQSQTQAQAKAQSQTHARVSPQAQAQSKSQRSSPCSPMTRNEEGASSLLPGPHMMKSLAAKSSEPPATKNARPALRSPAVAAAPEAAAASTLASPASSLSPPPPSAAAAAATTTSRSPHPPPEELIRPEEVQAALLSKPQRGKKRDNLSLSERMELTRTRNREHAKSTRVRKKARYQELLDREVEWNRLKEAERLSELRRRCVVDFMRLRTANVRRSREQLSGWHAEGEASSASTMTKPSLSPLSHNDYETQSPRGQDGHLTPMGTVQAAENNAQDARGQDGRSTPTGTAQASETNAQNDVKCTKGNLTINEMVDTTPNDSPSEPSPSATQATNGGKYSSEGDASSGFPKEEVDNSHVQFTSLEDFVDDPTRFCFGSLLPQPPFGKDISKMDGLTALSRHEAACRECVLQQLGAEAADHLSFSVVDSEQGVAIVHDSGFAQFRLTIATPSGEDGDGGDMMVSAGMMRVKFAPHSYKLRGIELCSYDTGGVVALGSNNGNQGVVSPGVRNGMITPVSFPSVVSLEKVFHDHIGVTSCDSGQEKYCSTPTKPDHSRQVGVSPEDRNQDGADRELDGSPDEQHGPGMNYESAQDDVARSDGD